MKVMFDINVVLDIVARRQPFYEDSSAAYLKVVGDGDDPCLSVHALSTLYYLLGSASTRKQRSAAMDWIFGAFKVAGLSADEVEIARNLGLSDFEDALVVAAAQSSGCSCIVTRNVRDFSRCGMRVADPVGYVRLP